MDRSLIILGIVVAISVVSAAIWHVAVKSYLGAVVGSAITVGLVTWFGYGVLRGVVPNALIIVNSLILAAAIAFGVGLLLKRSRMRKDGASNDA